MPRNCYQNLLRYLHFVNNDSINTQDKLAKMCPLNSMVSDEFVKIEPEEYNSVNKQIIATKQNICLSDNTIEKAKKVGIQKSCLH